MIKLTLLTALFLVSLSGSTSFAQTGAQTGNPSSSQTAFYGSVTAGPATPETKRVGLNEAIRMGIEHNLALVEAREQEKVAKAQSLNSLQPLLPEVTASADSGAHQVNLAAFGFSEKALAGFAKVFPSESFVDFSPIVRVNVTAAALNYSQTLFDLSSIDTYRASKAAARAAYFSTQSARGLVVLNIGNTYLQVLAAEADVCNADALLRSDQLLLNQTVAEHKAGTVPHLTERFRARVQMENQQLAVIQAENALAKGKITLNREIGLPPEQAIELSDATPYAELAAMNVAEARQQAYRNRQDYQGIQWRLREAELRLRASKWERLPSLRFDGNYGVTGITGGTYHGTFVATGSLNLPLFKEAKFRGDRDVAAADLSDLRDQFENLKQQIDQQLRDSILDLQSSLALVNVARSNRSLAEVALRQAIERFQAGVDDNLPVVEAQATLAKAEANLVQTTTEYNQAKLGLARNLGIVDTQYRTFLGTH